MEYIMPEKVNMWVNISDYFFINFFKIYNLKKNHNVVSWSLWCDNYNKKREQKINL